MSTLQTELNRLYFCDGLALQDPDTEKPRLVAADGRVRAMVLELVRPADWGILSTLWRGVQTDLELPAPAIAVNGVDGYQLWFSLSEPVSAAQAHAFLEALRARYLGTVVPARIRMMPFAEASAPRETHHARLIPAQQEATGMWSAFVAPDLASIFSEEPWIDLPPNPDAQANVLSHITSIPPAAFQAALERIGTAVSGTAECVSRGPAPQANGRDPHQFLLDIMNNQTIELHLRIDAAKALLPYSQDRKGM